MMQNLTCDECGANLPANAPLGLCPRCLIGTGLSLVAENDPARVEPVLGKTNPSSPGPNGELSCADRGTQPFGDYELIEEIAHGGMGVVYRARQLALERIVALKMLLFGKFASEQFVNRFRVEAQAVARLQHPNIVAIHEVGQHGGQHFFTMDYVEGKTLAELSRDGPMAVARAVKYMRSIAEAIHYAHTRGVLHRDLKPSNVLVDIHDEPRVTDFGLAKWLTDSEPSGTEAPLTTTGQVLGSPAFLPPEQAGRHKPGAGPENDVYSLGALLYNLLCGRPPFIAESLEGVLVQVLHSEPVSPRLLNPGVPRDLETICLKCLEKDPCRRYTSAKSLADDLTCFLRAEPISARPLNRAQRTVRRCQRQPAVAGLVAVAAVLLVSGSTLVLWQWRQAERERRRAEASAEHIRQLNYVSETALGFSQWSEGNLLPVLAALKGQIPQPGAPDLRGFEWRHLWWLAHRDSVRTLPACNQAAGAMSFSPDGTILAVYYWDEILRFWDLRSPEVEVKVVTITNAVSLGGFIANGDQCIVGTRGHSITVRSTRTGEILRSIAADGDLVAVAGNGQSLATIDAGSTLKVVDMATGRIKLTRAGPLRRRSDYGWGALITLSFDGKFLALARPLDGGARSDDAIEVWNLETSERMPVSVPPSRIRCLAFASDGSKLAAGNGDGSVGVWELAASEIGHFPGEGLPVLSIAFSPGGQALAVGGADETIQICDLLTGMRKSQVSRGPVGQVWALAYSPDGRTLASGSRNAPINLWDLQESLVPDSTEQLAPHEGWGNFTFSPDSRLMAAACRGTKINVWKVATFELVASFPGAAFVVAFSPKGDSLLLSTGDQAPMWWNFKTDRTTRIRNYPMAGVRSVDLSPDRQLAALGYQNGTIALLDLASENEAKVWPAHTDAVLSIKFSTAGDMLISGSRDRSITVWDVHTQKKLASNEPGEHRGAVCAVAYSPNGKRLASGCGADLIKLWDEAHLEKALGNMPFHKAAVRTLDFSPDGKTLASGSDDSTVRLFNVLLNKEITSFRMEHPVRLVLFSPDGNTLAAVTDAGTLRLLRATPAEMIPR